MKLHMIGHGHLDPVWLWNWQEGMQAVKATFRSALDRMKEYDDFIFTCSSACFYEFIEKNDPEMFSEIQARVAQGRWWIVGGWWIEPDCNLPCGESFARLALIAQCYFRDKFGVTAKTGFCPDSFGHSAGLPQILRQSGMENYLFMRPMPGEKALPLRLFRWRSPDGSEVLAYRLPYEYLTWGKGLDVQVARCLEDIRSPMESNLCFYGVGNHGGGPTRDNLESIRRLNEELDGALQFSTPDRFFAQAEQKREFLPIVEDDLQYHAPGCYSACSMVKAYNRRCESRLLTAEKFSVCAELIAGQPYPENFTGAWKKLLFNQFHDVLAGTCTASAYEDARNDFGYVLSVADEALNLALQAISWKTGIERDEKMTPVVVFNPHAWTVTASVEAEVSGKRSFTLVTDDNGNEQDFALVRTESTAGRRTRVAWMASVPPMGWRVYKFYEKAPETKGVVRFDNKYVLENEYLRLTFSPDCPGIQSVYDLENKTVISTKGLGIPVCIDDAGSDTWAHDVYQFQKILGRFTVEEVCLTEQNSLRGMMRVISRFGDSRIVQEFILYRGRRAVDVRVNLDWREKQAMLKLVFYPETIFNEMYYEAPYGVKKRAANGNEESGLSWVDYSGVSRELGGNYGLGLANNAKYSYSADKNSFSLTVLRSPVFAHHEPEPLQEGESYEYLEQGNQRFCYLLTPHRSIAEQSTVMREAAVLNAPLIPLVETYHTGTLAQSGSLFHVEGEGVQMSALKRAEDGQGYIVRLHEMRGLPAKVSLCSEVLGLCATLAFAPTEVKGLRLERCTESDRWRIKPVNFLEE